MDNLNIRTRAFFLASLMVVGAGATLSSCQKEEANNGYSETVEYDSFNELVSLLPAKKQQNLQNVYNELNRLNGPVAESVRVPEDGTKAFRVDWDTMQALVLAANDYTGDQMVEMFDVYEYDAEYLYELYKNFATIFIPFGERLTMSTGLDTLIDDYLEQEFFLKYENMLISINNARATDDSNLDILYQKAFDMIRADFLANTSGSNFANAVDKDRITGFNALVIPYINTIMELGRNSKAKLTDAEVEELNRDGICNTAYQSIKDNLDGYKLKVYALDKVENAGAYERARDLAIKSLEKDGIYFVSYAQSTLDILGNEELVYNDLVVTTKQSSKSGNNSTRKETKTRTYDNIDDLINNESSEVAEQAQKGKDEVDEKIDQENQKAKDEAQKRADEEAKKDSDKNKKESDDKMDDTRDNAQVHDGEGNVDETAEINQPSNPDEAISDVETTKPFDGPAYDADGNEIVNGKMNLFSGIFTRNIVNFLGNHLPKVKSLRLK